MSLSVASGKIWRNRETCTADKLSQMWGLASFNGELDQSDMASGAGLFVTSDTAPSDTDAAWYDSTLNLGRIYNGSVWVPQSRGLILTNKSGGALIRGDVVVVGTANDNAFTTTNSANNAIVIGVLGENIANDAAGLVITRGTALINLVSSESTGLQWIGTSTTVAKGLGNTAAVANKFARGYVSSTGASSITGFLFGQPLL